MKKIKALIDETLRKYNIGFGYDLYCKCSYSDVFMNFETPKNKIKEFWYADAIYCGPGDYADATIVLSFPNNAEIVRNAYNEMQLLKTNCKNNALYLLILESLNQLNTNYTKLNK